MYVTLGVFVTLVVLLLSGKIGAIYIFSGASIVLVLSRVISVNQFIGAFANSSVLSIFVLLFLARVVRDHFNLVGWLDKMYARTSSPRWFVLKNSLVISALSSVMNNTPIVALMIPFTYTWAERNGISASKLLMPVSFAAITGGMITVIGTSTNLVLNGFLDAAGLPLLSFTDYLLPGVLVSLLAAVYAATIGFDLLPDNKRVTSEELLNEKSYLMEVDLSELAQMEGKTVMEAGLRNVQGVYLAEIARGNRLISPVTPETVLHDGDRLIFAGDHSELNVLVNNTLGFRWGKTDEFAIADGHGLLEAVIPYNSTLIGCTLKQYGFRAKYASAVIGIHRNSTQLTGRLGDIALQAGDLLIIAGSKSAEKNFKGQKDLYVINRIQESDNIAVNVWQRFGFLGFVFGSVFLSLVGNYSFFISLLFVLVGAVLTGLTNTKKIKEDLNIELFIILGSAIVLGVAMVDSGLGAYLGEVLHGFSPHFGSWNLLFGLMAITVLLTSFVTNVAAISIIFPITFSMLSYIDISSQLVFLAIAFSGSAAFITPVSYQTNLMVQSPGGYSSKDYLRYGFPMLLLYFGVVISYLYCLN